MLITLGIDSKANLIVTTSHSPPDEVSHIIVHYKNTAPYHAQVIPASLFVKVEVLNK
mgnify:CR=1 FL=1